MYGSVVAFIHCYLDTYETAELIYYINLAAFQLKKVNDRWCAFNAVQLSETFSPYYIIIMFIDHMKKVTKRRAAVNIVQYYTLNRFPKTD